MIHIGILLLLTAADALEHHSSAQVSQNSSCNEIDITCHLLQFVRNHHFMKDVELRIKLNQQLFSWINSQEEKWKPRPEHLHNNSDRPLANESGARFHTFIETQLQRRADLLASSRAVRAALHLAIAAACNRPAVVCIASRRTCQQWDDSGLEINEHIRTLGNIINERFPEISSRHGLQSFLTALGGIKGALLQIVKHPNILTNINWFTNDVSPRGLVEASDCVYLMSETKEDAFFMLSKSEWSASARYVIVIMKQLRDTYYGDFTELLYDMGNEDEGVDIDEVTFPEFNLRYQKDRLNKTEDILSDFRRNRREVQTNNNQLEHNNERLSEGDCEVFSFNLLRLLWNNRRLLHTAVFLSGCNHPAMGFIRKDVSTFPIYLLRHSGEGIVFSGGDVVATLEMMRTPLTNLGGRTLRVSLFERKPTAVLISEENGEPSKFAGQDAWLMRLSARSLNFRVLVEEPEDNSGFGYFLENGTSSGSIRNVLRGKVDISFNGFLVMDYGTHAVEFSSPFGFDELCVVVPQSGALPGWAALLTTIPPVIIGLAPPTIIGITLLFLVIRRLLHIRGSPVSDLLSIVSVCLSVSTRLPKVCSQRLLLLGAMVASLVITGAFQGLIVRSIALPRYPTQIDTLKALDESGFYIATGSETLKSTFDVPGSSITMQNLLKKTIVITKKEYLTNTNRFARIVRRSGVESDLSPNEHLVKECPRHYPVAFLMRRGSPIANALNSVLLRFASAGFTETFESLTHGIKKPQESKDTPQKVFSLQDLQGPFIILGCGLGISTIEFLFEIRKYWRRTTKTKKFLVRRVKRRLSV